MKFEQNNLTITGDTKKEGSKRRQSLRNRPSLGQHMTGEKVRGFYILVRHTKQRNEWIRNIKYNSQI